MTLFHLVRHADHDLLGRVLAGRTDVALSGSGREQAERLASRLAERSVERILASPLARTRETADAIAAACGAPVEVNDALLEVDFGDWTGMGFAELERRDDWRTWNGMRSLARPPGGETIAEVQARACGFLHAVARDRPDGTFAVVSHGDVIRSVLAHHLGVPIDLFLRIDIAPASLSTLVVDPWGPRILGMNDTAAAAQPDGADKP